FTHFAVSSVQVFPGGAKSNIEPTDTGPPAYRHTVCPSKVHTRPIAGAESNLWVRVGRAKEFLVLPPRLHAALQFLGCEQGGFWARPHHRCDTNQHSQSGQCADVPESETRLHGRYSSGCSRERCLRTVA